MTFLIFNDTHKYIGSATKPKPRSPKTWWTITYSYVKGGIPYKVFGGGTAGTVADMKRFVREIHPKATFKRRG